MSFLKDPLTHFLVAGLSLFLLFQLFGPDQLETNNARIVVDREALLTFVQYRTKTFEPTVAAKRLGAMSQDQLDRTIEDYTREEALHREALALGLDGEDYVIRRRLVQKLEFIARGLVDAGPAPADAEVVAYFDANKDDYFVVPTLTFTHVFFDAEKRGWNQAREQGGLMVGLLNKTSAPFSDAPKHGDRFLYQLNYVERTFDHVASHFGAPMAQALADLTPSGERWSGYYESPYGTHVVMLTKNQPGRYPTMDEVRGRLEGDTLRAQAKERTEEAIALIVGSYDIDITYQPSPAETVAK